MKNHSFVLCLIIAMLASCANPDNNNNNDDDTSPGVDEFFRVDINAYHWEENDDEVMGGVLANFGSGPIYSLTATSHVDSSHFTFIIPYFYANDTTWNLTPPPANMALTFQTDSIYNEVSSGTMHIIRTNVGGMEVFTGTFNYTGLELLHDSPATFANGEFVIARLL
jgi:hypothetical protein